MTSKPTSMESQFVLRERAQALLEAKGASLTRAKDPGNALRVLFRRNQSRVVLDKMR